MIRGGDLMKACIDWCLSRRVDWLCTGQGESVESDHWVVLDCEEQVCRSMTPTVRLARPETLQAWRWEHDFGLMKYRGGMWSGRGGVVVTIRCDWGYC